MGFFGGDNDDYEPGQNEANQLATEQMEQNKEELEVKKQNLYAARLDIIKGQGGQSWVPDRTSRAAAPRTSGGGGISPPWGRR